MCTRRSGQSRPTILRQVWARSSAGADESTLARPNVIRSALQHLLGWTLVVKAPDVRFCSTIDMRLRDATMLTGKRKPDRCGSETTFTSHGARLQSQLHELSCCRSKRPSRQVPCNHAQDCGARRTQTVGSCVHSWHCQVNGSILLSLRSSDFRPGRRHLDLVFMCRHTDTFAIAGARGFANNKTSTGPHGGSGVRFRLLY